MELSLSLGDSNWRQVMWKEIYDRARKKGQIRKVKLDFHKFEYALINPEHNYEGPGVSTTGKPYKYTSDSVTFWIKDAEEEGRIGLNEEGLAFVLERCTPPEFRDVVGLHEHTEATGKDHPVACSVELDAVMKDPELFKKYAEWLVSLHESVVTNPDPESKSRGYFERAVPDFLDVLREGRLSPTEILTEFRRRLDSII